MSMSGIVDWLTILFFVWFGLRMFVPALQKGFTLLGGFIALAAAIAILLDTSP